MFNPPPMCLKEPLISYQLEVEGGRLGYFFAGGGGSHGYSEGTDRGIVIVNRVKAMSIAN